LDLRCTFAVPGLSCALRRLPSAPPLSAGLIVLAACPRFSAARLVVFKISAGAPPPRPVTLALLILVLATLARIAIVFFPFTR
jgi:hypothetical protein